MDLFKHVHTDKAVFQTFEKLYAQNVYSTCNLLRKFSIDTHTLCEYEELLKTHPETPNISNIEDQPFSCYIAKHAYYAKDTTAGIIINEVLCSKLRLTLDDKLAAIAHEIGHIMYFFLEGKERLNEELKADEFAGKMGFAAALSRLLEKLAEANSYDEEAKNDLMYRSSVLKKGHF